MRILDNLIYRADKFNEVKIQYKLGIIYLEGDRVEPNLDEAKRWLERAADQGHEEAARALEGLEGKPKELQAQTGDDYLQAEDYDEGTPPIIASEPRELPVDWGDESSGPPVISKPAMTAEEIGRKLGSQLKGVFGKTPSAGSHSGESGGEKKKSPGCGAVAWVIAGVLYVLINLADCGS